MTDGLGEISYRLPSLRVKDTKPKRCEVQNFCLRAQEYAGKICNNPVYILQLKTKQSDQVNTGHAELPLEDLDRNEGIATPESVTTLKLLQKIDIFQAVLDENASSFNEEVRHAYQQIVNGIIKGLNHIEQVQADIQLPSIEYHNFVSQAPVHLRLLNAVERRRPTAHNVTECRGCKLSGPLPWLFSDRYKIPRIGGGYRYISENLPVVKSKRLPTIPKDPFSHERPPFQMRKRHHPTKKVKKVTSCIPFSWETKITGKNKDGDKGEDVHTNHIRLPAISEADEGRNILRDSIDETEVDGKESSEEEEDLKDDQIDWQKAGAIEVSSEEGAISHTESKTVEKEYAAGRSKSESSARGSHIASSENQFPSFKKSKSAADKTMQNEHCRPGPMPGTTSLFRKSKSSGYSKRKNVTLTGDRRSSKSGVSSNAVDSTGSLTAGLLTQPMLKEATGGVEINKNRSKYAQHKIPKQTPVDTGNPLEIQNLGRGNKTGNDRSQSGGSWSLRFTVTQLEGRSAEASSRNLREDETKREASAKTDCDDEQPSSVQVIPLVDSTSQAEDLEEEEEDDLEDIFVIEEEEMPSEDDLEPSIAHSTNQEEVPLEEKPTKRRKPKPKRKRTLQNQIGPLSRYTLKRGNRKMEVEDDYIEEGENFGESVVDFAARFCILSLDRLTKFEKVFLNFASSPSTEEGRFTSTTQQTWTTEQKIILDNYDKTLYSLDMYQQKLNELESKKHEAEEKLTGFLTSIDEAQYEAEGIEATKRKQKVLEERLAKIENRMEYLLRKRNSFSEQKRKYEDELRTAGVSDEDLKNMTKISNYLTRKFSKLQKVTIQASDVESCLGMLAVDLTPKEVFFVHQILQLPSDGILDFKTFCVVVALSERLASLDSSVKLLLQQLDMLSLERKLDKCKELFRLVSTGSSNAVGDLSVDDLTVELAAGGISGDQKRSVLEKLTHNDNGMIDFLNFTLYVPLFMMIHDQIVSQPL